MKSKHLLAGLALAVLLPGAATAQTRPVYSPYDDSLFTRALSDVEKAFYRKQSYADPVTGLREPAPASLAELASYGFMPGNANFAMSVTALDAAQSRVCLEMRVNSEALWRAAAHALATPGVVRADAQCQPASESPLPKGWPATLYAVKVLDSEDAMTATLLPSAPVVYGLDSQAYARPAITLPAAAGQWSQAGSFVVINPALPALEGQPAAPAMSIVKASVRSGFAVDHNCVQVAAQQSCTVAVRYLGSASEMLRVGRLRLDFSDGHFAIVGLLGKRGTGLPTVMLTSASVSATSAPTTSTSLTTETGSTVQSVSDTSGTLSTTTSTTSTSTSSTTSTSTTSTSSTPTTTTSTSTSTSTGCVSSSNTAACLGGRGRLRRGA